MSSPRKPFHYRMCGCEIEELPNPYREKELFMLFHGMSLVAFFKDRHAAINYLAKEFAVTIHQHDET